MDEVKSGLTLQMAKAMADRAILDVKNGIVTAGYALRAIRNEKLWKEHGYTSFDAFMEICYQKDKSWASNCIRVYEQFGELAGPEQMPRLQAKYQEYSAGGLIEMLSMPEELREQVTADMPVREIRELKREARKVATSQPEEEEQLEGQMDITDFPEFMPEPCAAETQQLEKAQQEEKPEPEEWEEKDGWTARETGGSDVIHVTELADDMDEWDSQDEEPAAERQPESHWSKTCITGWSKYGNCVCCGAGGVECCASCQVSCNSRCGWIPEPEKEPGSDRGEAADVIHVEEFLPEEPDGKDEQEADASEELLTEDSEDQTETVQRKLSVEGLLEKYERELAEMQEAFQDTPKEQWPLSIEKTQILTAALQLLAEQERKQQEELESLGQAQPELPLMKNNNQRKEWLRNYQAWGLWYEDERIGVRYYKYEFDNGARLIAEEYPAAGKMNFTASYLHLVGGPEPPKHPSYGIPRWSRHARYDKHPDSETELVEFLKAVQR